MVFAVAAVGNRNYLTRSQAVARIADRTASQSHCRTRQSNSDDKSKPLAKFEVTSSNSFEYMFDRMLKNAGVT